MASYVFKRETLNLKIRSVQMRMTLRKTAIGCLFLILFCGVAFSTQAKAAEKGSTDAFYIIGPRDVLEIQVWREPDFSRQVLVRPDGKITFPLVGDVEASGLTTMELKQLLTDKLQGYVDSPEVTISVVESNSKYFFIIGKVNAPGTYNLTPGMTVLQALSVAGGFAQWAHKDGVRIIRKSGGEETIFTFDYDKVISGKQLNQNILLEPHDTIVVP
jgi:polysaccharide biosynthesis/export protein